MKKIDYGDEIRPVFTQKEPVVCVFEISEQYAAIYDVFLRSFLKNISQDHYYDIIILSSDISAASERQISELVQNAHNISVRFYNPTRIVYERMEKSKHKYLDLNYYRLALPWILKCYDRALNLGADMIIMHDVYGLYNTPMDTDTYIAGVRDLDYVGRINRDIPASELDLSIPENYVNADVLLYNLKQIRDHFSMDSIFDLWDQYLFRLAEQDVINVYFDGHILLLDGRWNVFPKGMISDEHIEKTDICFQEEWERTLKDPYIIHFAGAPKPWNNPEVGYGTIWWKYAMESPYYPIFLHKVIDNALARKPLLNRTIDILLPKDSKIGIIIKDSTVWMRLRRIYYNIVRGEDMKEFGKGQERKNGRN